MKRDRWIKTFFFPQHVIAAGVGGRGDEPHRRGGTRLASGRRSQRASARTLRRAAAVTGRPGSTSIRGWGSPARVSGETSVASNASCEPCQKDRPLQQLLRACRQRWARRCSYRCGRHAHRPRGKPASSGLARAASTPLVAQAARWSPKASSLPRQLHARGAEQQGQA